MEIPATPSNRPISLELLPSSVVVELDGDEASLGGIPNLPWHRRFRNPRIFVTINNESQEERRILLRQLSDCIPGCSSIHCVSRFDLLDLSDDDPANTIHRRDDSIACLTVRDGESLTVELEVELDFEVLQAPKDLTIDIEAIVEPEITGITRPILRQVNLQLRSACVRFLDKLPLIYRDTLAAEQDTLSAIGESPFFERFLLGLEDFLASLRTTIRRLEQLLGPSTVPSNMVLYLATWLAIPVDEAWPEMVKRRLVIEAVDLYRCRGTKRCLERLLEIATGCRPEINDTVRKGLILGEGARLGAEDGVLGGVLPNCFVVTAFVLPGQRISEYALHEIIEFARPAHTSYSLQIVEKGNSGEGMIYGYQVSA